MGECQLDLLDHPSYHMQSFRGTDLVVKAVGDKRLIVVPEDLMEDLVSWHHITQCHPSASRMQLTLGMIYTGEGLEDCIKQFASSCEECQKKKDPGPGYGELPAKMNLPDPFEEVGVDYVGPWTVETAKFGAVEFNAMTMTDSASSAMEITRTDGANPTSLQSTMVFENEWPWIQTSQAKLGDYGSRI